MSLSLADALGPQHGDARPWCVAQLLDVDAVTNRAQVSIDGGPAVWLPFVSNSFDGITTVMVLRDPGQSGAGQLVLGPCGTQPDPPPPPPVQPTPSDPVSDPVTKTVRTVITPTWSGTYRDSWNSWSITWNAGRYGGPSTLYQGSKYGSGGLRGLATYGSQVANLRASQITSMKVTVKVATSDTGTVVLQGSPNGSRPGGAPSSSGALASRAGSGQVELPASVREAFRTGAVKGLALVGSDYLGVRGTSLASGMALAITYVRPA